MGAAREAELAAQLAVALEENARQRSRMKRLVDELNDAEENTRVYRRLAYRVIAACDSCPFCDPRSLPRDHPARH